MLGVCDRRVYLAVAVFDLNYDGCIYSLGLASLVFQPKQGKNEIFFIFALIVSALVRDRVG
jgi:hypothetical protein